MAGKSHPAVLTLTGDNGLTIAFMGGIGYVGALLLVQIARRVAPGFFGVQSNKSGGTADRAAGASGA